MLFQALDNKKECYAIYCNDTLYHYPNNLDLTHTWSYTPHFDDKDVEYAKIWAGGLSLGEVCPEGLRDEWNSVDQKAKAFLTSFQAAKVNLDDVCFYDLVPKKFLIEYCAIKNKITDWVFEHYKKPKNYDFLLQMTKMISKIDNQRLNVNKQSLSIADSAVRMSLSKISSARPYVNYNLWGTATGRLSTKKTSFPILTLNKELRNALKPNNDLFVELDYNSAELRVLFGLLGQPQPEEDVHAWIGKNIFEDKYSRDDTKKKVFSWLYNPNAKNKKLNEYLNRDAIIKKYYSSGNVFTPYDRKIHVEEDKALNYMIQSTASDMLLTSALKIDKLLKNRKSYISFCVHDSLVLDFSKEDQPLLEELTSLFSETKMGKLRTNLSIGRDYGTMRKIT